jgi:hypothetical protein
MSAQRPADFRSHAAFLVGTSVVVLLLISLTLQLAAWELRAYYRSQHVKLPVPADTFFDMFGHRPDSYLVAVVLWLWWPMVASLLYCHFRHRATHEFAIAFLYWFASCWMLAAGVIAFILVLCGWPILGNLLADLQESPDYMVVVSVISWALPNLTVIFGVACWLRFRRRPDQGISNSSDSG